jgi:hypothetical protein
MQIHESLNDLHAELSEAQTSERNTAALRGKIRAVESEDATSCCGQRDFLSSYRKFLEEKCLQ